MSDTNNTIISKNFLEICVQIEERCAALYDFYSDIYEDIPDASFLWNKTARANENHQKQFELALRLLSETEFEVSKASLSRAYTIQSNLIQFMEYIKNNKPGILTAVSKAVELEERLAELHVQSSLNFKDKSIHNLFKAMSKTDYDPVAALKLYWTILYLPQCEIN